MVLARGSHRVAFLIPCPSRQVGACNERVTGACKILSWASEQAQINLESQQESRCVVLPVLRSPFRVAPKKAVQAFNKVFYGTRRRRFRPGEKDQGFTSCTSRCRTPLLQGNETKKMPPRQMVTTAGKNKVERQTGGISCPAAPACGCQVVAEVWTIILCVLFCFMTRTHLSCCHTLRHLLYALERAT